MLITYSEELLLVTGKSLFKAKSSFKTVLGKWFLRNNLTYIILSTNYLKTVCPKVYGIVNKPELDSLCQHLGDRSRQNPEFQASLSFLVYRVNSKSARALKTKIQKKQQMHLGVLYIPNIKCEARSEVYQVEYQGPPRSDLREKGT